MLSPVSDDGGFSPDSCATSEMSLQRAPEGAVGALFGDDGGEDRWQTTAPVASLPIREREDLLAVESATGTAVIVRSIIGESCSDAQLADLLGAKGHDLRQLDLRK